MSLRRLLLISWTLALLCWGALAAIVHLFAPSQVWQAVALVLATAGAATTTTPLWWRVQQRLDAQVKVEALPRLAARQGLWAGLFVGLVLLLRLLQALDGALVLVLLALFVMLEMLIQQRGQKSAAPAVTAKPQEKKEADASFARQGGGRRGRGSGRAGGKGGRGEGGRGKRE